MHLPQLALPLSLDKVFPEKMYIAKSNQFTAFLAILFFRLTGVLKKVRDFSLFLSRLSQNTAGLVILIILVDT